MTIKIKTLLKLLEDCSDDLTIEELITFMCLASHLHHEILHTQRPAHPEEVAPESDLLPPHVMQFLAQSMLRLMINKEVKLPVLVSGTEQV